MKFDYDAYDKIYPRKVESEPVESAVSTFTPSNDEETETEELPVKRDTVIEEPMIDDEVIDEMKEGD